MTREQQPSAYCSSRAYKTRYEQRHSRAKARAANHGVLRRVWSKIQLLSCVQGSKDFPRIRVGIGRPEGQMPIPTYVLQVRG